MGDQNQQNGVDSRRRVANMNPITAEQLLSEGASRSRANWLIHIKYVREDHEECLKLIDEVLKECENLCEYALFVKALIKRQRGQITESLTLFQQATALNPTNVCNLKQVAKSLFLLGKHRDALEVYEEAQAVGSDDWEVFHNMGVCRMYLKEYDKAAEMLQMANAMERHDTTYIQLGKVYSLQQMHREAVEVYQEAVEFSPDNPELLTTLGLLYLRVDDNLKAFDCLGNSLTHDPKNPKTILAAGSVIQDNSDMDVALVKYRVAAVQTPNSAQLWNNVGMCFFGKQRYVAAIACLKRALYLEPFEWIIAYNLGLVHLCTEQYASAFHYFSSSINLKPDFASSYMYLGVALNRLDDFDNACSAYEKALELEEDHVFHLNYAITLFNNEEVERAQAHFVQFERLFGELDPAMKDNDPDVILQRTTLSNALSAHQSV